MKPVKTDYANVTFVAEGCFDLPGTIAQNEDYSAPQIETCWELSPEELEEVKRTGRVYLYVLGKTIPPVMLTTSSLINFGGANEHS